MRRQFHGGGDVAQVRMLPTTMGSSASRVARESAAQRSLAPEMRTSPDRARRRYDQFVHGSQRARRASEQKGR